MNNKVFPLVIPLLTTLLIISCVDNSSEKKTTPISETTESADSTNDTTANILQNEEDTTVNIIQNEEDTTIGNVQDEEDTIAEPVVDTLNDEADSSQNFEYRFVATKSGLRYRDSPKGKVLGKFPPNHRLKIVEYTDVQHSEQTGRGIYMGRWVGVEKGLDTVYVFNGLLSVNQFLPNIDLYLLSIINHEKRMAFINVSDVYFSSLNTNKNPILSYEDKLNKHINLNQNQRRQFLKAMGISESDQVFVHSYREGKTHILMVKDLSVIARMNDYGPSYDDRNLEEDYMFGFSFELQGVYGELVHIGKENPFTDNKLTPIIWEEIDSLEFPKKFSLDIVGPSIRSWYAGFQTGKSYKFSTGSHDYFTQNLDREKITKKRYVIVTDANTGDIVYEKAEISSEGEILERLTTGEDKEEHYNQWTGKLFVDRPVVMFGFTYFPYGCPEFILLSKENYNNIYTYCDNRH